MGVRRKSPEEAKLREAEKDYLSALKRAEKDVREAVRAYEKRIKAAQERLNKAKTPPLLGKYGSISLYENRISTGSGSSSLLAGPLTTSVSASGNVVMKKDKKIDTRKLFLEVRSPSFVHVESANPDHEERVRKLAATIEQTSASAAEAKARREGSIKEADEELASSRRDRSGIEGANATLKEVKSRKERLDRTRATAGLEPLPEQFFTPARRRKRILVWALASLLALIGAIAALASLGGGTKNVSNTIPETTSTPAAPTTQTTTRTTGETSATTTTAPPPLPTVASVIDGDTLDLESGDRIRLVQIDAPEGKGECYGKKAGKVLRQLLPVGTEVRIVRDRRLDNVDRYGRQLRYVFKGTKNINLVLVQQGAASVWFFQGDKGRYATRLLHAAENASRARRGAWGACEATLDPSHAFQTHPKQNTPDNTTPQQSGCEPGYSPCLPITGDLDCADVEAMGLAPVSVSGADRYRLDGDGDGVGCE